MTQLSFKYAGGTSELGRVFQIGMTCSEKSLDENYGAVLTWT